MLGSATAPIAAGWLLGVGSWRLIFAVLAVVSVLVAGVVWSGLRDADRGSSEIPLHVARNVVIGVGLAALVWGLIRAGAKGWGSPEALVPALIGAGTLLSVLGRLRATRQGGFASASIGSVLLVIVLATLGYIATVFLLGIYLQRIGGASPLQAGLRLVPFLGVAAVVSPLAGRLTATIGERPVLLSSFAFEIVGLVWLSRLGVHSSYAAVWPALTLMGLSISTLTPAALSLLMRSAAPERAGLLGALFGGSSQLGGVLSVAVMGSVLASSVAGRFERLLALAGVHPLAASATAGLAQGIAPRPAGAGAGTLRVIGLAARQAFVGSMDLAFVCSTVAAAVALCVGLALERHLRAPKRAG
jgi:MFS family permease